jgi:adenine deaminase
MQDVPVLRNHIDQAMGRVPADLVIRNIAILDVVSGQVREGDIAICGRFIVGVYDEYHGAAEIDGRGLYAVPGFIDTHVHVESSLVPPYEFERMVLPRGTTTAICDPHEMANVLGTPALDFFLRSSAGMIMDLKVSLPSCVPATPIGTSGAVLSAADLAPYAWRAHGLAEVMSLPGILETDPDMIHKLDLFWDRHVDGHMPGLGWDAAHGRMLNALAAANIKTDHESTAMPEALAKQQRGIRLLIREGTGCKNLAALMPLITTANSFTTAFCTDDFHPADIVRDGHLNFVIRKAIALYDPDHHGPDRRQHIVNVYRTATLAAAQIFGFNQHGLNRRGEIVPGALADIVLLRNLETCDVATVIKAGRIVTEDLFRTRPAVPAVGYDSVKIGTVTAADFKARSSDPDVVVIGVIPDNVLTTAIHARLEIRDGELCADPSRDILKAAVVERHGRTPGNIGVGFVNGFQLKHGAIASTVGHDDHNITVVGVNGEDMAAAVNALKAMGGGYVVVDHGQVVGSLPLPMAGLMSETSFEETARREESIRAAVRTLLPDGVAGLPQPLISTAFISLSVIPDVRLCDAGLTRNDGTGPRLVVDQRGQHF